jgi:hypothetical protein
MAARRRSSQPDTAAGRSTVADDFVAVIIVNYRTPKLTMKCLQSLEQEQSSFRKLEAMVVDGGSGDGSAEELAAWIGRPEYRDWVDLLALDLNGGYGWANNEAMRALGKKAEQPDYIQVLNPDTEVESGAVKVLAEYLDNNPRVAAVGSQLFEPDGSKAGSAFNFPTLRGELARGARTGLFDRLLNVPPIAVTPRAATAVDWVTGASVMFRTEALRQVGLFDEGFFLYHEEIELMWRLRRARWAIAFEPRSRVRHVGGAATGVRSIAAPTQLGPRKPAYWYRSRTRMFALIGGRSLAAGAFMTWLIGHLIWRTRRALGFAPGTQRIDHELRDHLRLAFPRAADAQNAVGSWDAEPGARPAWMLRGRL